MTADWTSFHFIRPWWLLLLPLATTLWWFWQRHSDPLNGWRQQITPALLGALTTGGTQHRRLPVQLRLIVWLLAVVAIAGPTWKPEPSPFADDATPMLILLKAGTSMNLPDPAPSRIDRAHLKIADLAETRKGQPLGLIAYAGSAHLVLPPTRDTTIVARMAAEISSGIMPAQGDRLDLALRKAVKMLDKGHQGGTILVLADSVDTDPVHLQTLKGELAFPVQFLAINTPDSPEDATLRTAARVLGARVEPMDVEGNDIEHIIRLAAATPVMLGNDGTDSRWQEAGYWLVPILTLLLLVAFRREKTREALG